MSRRTEAKDLFVLAADLDISNALEALLRCRSESLGIRNVVFRVARHPNRDGGCRTRAVEYLRPYIEEYDHALVVFDHEGCGDTRGRRAIQRDIEGQLKRNGWDDRAKVIIIDPEIEAWVWGDSPDVTRVLGWETDYHTLRRWLQSRGLWPRGRSKPSDPKKAMREAMQHKRARRSPRKFSDLAEAVDFDGCRDPAFNDLRKTLQAWFPREAAA